MSAISDLLAKYRHAVLPRGGVYVDEYSTVRREMWDEIRENMIKPPRIGDHVLMNSGRSEASPCVGMVTKANVYGISMNVNVAVFDSDGAYVGGMIGVPYDEKLRGAPSWAWMIEKPPTT